MLLSDRHGQLLTVAIIEGGERQPGPKAGLPVAGAGLEDLQKSVDSKSAAFPFRGAALSLVRIGHCLYACKPASPITFPLDTGGYRFKGRHQSSRI